MQESQVIGADLLSRLSYYLQRALVRIAREAQRISKSVGKCGKQEIASSLKIVLSPTRKLYFRNGFKNVKSRKIRKNLT